MKTATIEKSIEIGYEVNYYDADYTLYTIEGVFKLEACFEEIKKLDKNKYTNITIDTFIYNYTAKDGDHTRFLVDTLRVNEI